MKIKSYFADRCYYKDLVKLKFKDQKVCEISLNDQIINLEQKYSPIITKVDFNSEQNQFLTYENLKILYINTRYNNILFGYFLIFENDILTCLLFNTGNYIYINQDNLLEYNAYFKINQKNSLKDFQKIGYEKDLSNISITQQYGLLDTFTYQFKNKKIVIKQCDLDNFNIDITD